VFGVLEFGHEFFGIAFPEFLVNCQKYSHVPIYERFSTHVNRGLPNHPNDVIEMAIRTIHGSELQQRRLHALWQSADLREAPDDLLATLLHDFGVMLKDLEAASSAIYAKVYYRCAKDTDVTRKEGA